MKLRIPKLQCFVPLMTGLVLAVGGLNLHAALTYWDPFAGAGTATSDYTGVWENTLWASSTASAATQIAWPETGNAAAFTMGSTSTTPAFTVTMNSLHTVAGIFNSGLTGVGVCNVTIAGPGSIFIPGTSTTAQGFSAATGAFTKINVPMSGASIVTLEGAGQVFLNATNTYTGGTMLGYSTTTPFSGILNYLNGSSFGTGAIIVSNTSTAICGLVAEGTTAVTITNKITWANSGGGVNIVGNPAGVTFSGTMAINANNTNANLFVGGTGNLIIMSGIISGGKAGGLLNKGNASTLRLSGANTYIATTTVSNGVLQAGVAGAIPSGSGKGDLWVYNPGVFDINGVSPTCNGLVGDGPVTNSSATAGTFSVGGNNVSSTFNGTITSNPSRGALNLTKTGTGTFTMAGTGTYTGATTINGGTLIASTGNSAVPANSPVVIASGAILDVAGNSMTLTNLSGRGIIINNSGALTVVNNSTTNSSTVTYGGFGGGIDNGSLDKEGNGSLALRGTNNLPNGVTINGGTLSVGAGPDRIASAGGAVLTIGNGATFQLDAATQTVAQISGSGVINLGGGTLYVNTPLGNTYAGVIRDTDLGTNSTAQGHGLRGYYYDNQDFSTLLTVRDDANLNFTDLTSATQLPAPIYPNTNQTSIRWLGQVLSTAAGTYTFAVTADDGVRLWVGGIPVIDGWTTGSSTRTGTITLAAGTRYDIIVEYFNQTGLASCKLAWTPPGDTVSTIIPTDFLFLPTPGSVVKDGAGSLQLTGTNNTYTGSTIVKAGTLQISADHGLGLGNVYVQDGATLTLDTGTVNDYIANSADLILTASASVNLNYTGTDTVRSLSLDGGATFKTAGTYGAPGSGAQHEDSHFN
ncbi:MAG: PA14 domain-containing protein, partial [Limisphaerales bacterium]